MDFDFSGKVVLVTGASAGIGEATAIFFAKCGAKLSLVGRDETRLLDVAGRCQKEKELKPLSLIADLSTDEGCEKVAKETLDYFGRLDVLVNNAGITARKSLQRADMETFDSVFNTNVRGVYNLTRLLVAALVESKGNIINVSSVAGSTVIVGNLPYGMSKAALDQFTRAISLELAPKGVRVNSVSPGITISRILQRATNFTDAKYADWLEASAKRVPMGEVCTGEDIARTIVFLASDHARLITGDIIPIDEGLRYGNISDFATKDME